MRERVVYKLYSIFEAMTSIYLQLLWSFRPGTCR